MDEIPLDPYHRHYSHGKLVLILSGFLGVFFVGLIGLLTLASNVSREAIIAQRRLNELQQPTPFLSPTPLVAGDMVANADGVAGGNRDLADGAARVDGEVAGVATGGPGAQMGSGFGTPVNDRDMEVSRFIADYPPVAEPESADAYMYDAVSETIGRAIGEYLGITNFELNGQNLIGSSASEDTESSYSYGILNGSIEYSDPVGISINLVDSAKPQPDDVLNYLISIGIADDTLQYDESVRMPESSGISYYFFRRNTGSELPVVSTTNLLYELSGSAQETQLTTAVGAGALLVGLRSTGEIIEIVSNARIIATEDPDLPLIDSDVAFELIQSGAYEKIISRPISTDPNSPLPIDVPDPGTIVLTEAQVAYIENHPSTAATALIPYWIMSGYAGTENESVEAVIVTVPAVDTSTNP